MVKEHWINIYWKNRDDPLFENIRPEIRDKINSTISPKFIAEAGGKGEVKNNRLYLEFVKLPLQIEIEEWEHRTRFKSIPIKAIIGIETSEIEVDYVEDIKITKHNTLIKASKWAEKTLFCFIKNDKIMCELYEIFPMERIDTAHIKITSQSLIKKFQKKGYELIENRGKEGAIFKIKPIKVGETDTITFNSSALIKTKHIQERVLEIQLNPQTWKIMKYQKRKR